jgi:2-haloacid dehalogenase
MRARWRTRDTVTIDAMSIVAPTAFVFDAYGTLFDVHSVVMLAEQLAPGAGTTLSRLWRAKQLEYSWLQSLMATPAHPREDFAAVTAHALDYALAALLLPIDGAARARLLDAYLHLAPFAGARDVLRALAPRPRVILSNGSRAMLAPLVAASGLAEELDAVLSVDDADIYKPSPAVYRLATIRLALPAGRIAFVSSNGWDAAGAKAFGFTTFWINRDGMPVERHGPAPDFVVADLAALPPIVAALRE